MLSTSRPAVTRSSPWRPARGRGTPRRNTVWGGSPERLARPVHRVQLTTRSNAYAERWVRTVRSECLDWTLIWNHRQLHQVLTEYLRHYNTARPHRSLDLQPPSPPPTLTLIEPSTMDKQPVRRIDVLDGLIHKYRRAA